MVTCLVEGKMESNEWSEGGVMGRSGEDDVMYTTKAFFSSLCIDEVFIVFVSVM